jgi:hypothetical protein
MKSPRKRSIGAALWTTLARLIIVCAGYSAAFLTTGAVAAAGFVLFLLAMLETQAEKSSVPEFTRRGGGLSF